MLIQNASKSALEHALSQHEQQHQAFLEQKLSLDITRGKPSAAQLDLSNALLNSINPSEVSNKSDLRNYGILSGIPEAKALFGEFLGINSDERQQRIFIGGNSSLTLMHYTLWFSYHLGIKPNSLSWLNEEQESQKKTKILCPSPGYDRHFSICQQLGIEMIPIALTGNGPDMDAVESLVKADPSIKGIWCVPRFSNPTGEVYNDETVKRLAELPRIAGDNFLVLWDNAYALHSIDANAAQLANIDQAAKSAGTQESIIQFGSTSKITFAGSGIGYMAAGINSMTGFSQHFSMASIGSDKINQLRHVKFLKNVANTQTHMEKHAAIIKPKFDAVTHALNTHLADTGMGEWNNPKGGYFVSFNTQPGLASKVISLAADVGVKITPAGSTYPNMHDAEDKNIRIAPTLPELEAVEKAMEVFVNCVKIASIKQQLATRYN